MTRAMYLVGPPGVGKTSVMTCLKRPYLEGDAHRAWDRSLLWMTPLFSEDHVAGVELGRRRDRFGGTDALGMSVMPHAKLWVTTATLPALVLGEGARLGTVPFLSLLAEYADLTVVHLTADPGVLDTRRALRGSNQSPSWMRGAETRARNAADELAARGVHVVRLDASQESPAELASHLMEIRT